jgi:hypothetical protein
MISPAPVLDILVKPERPDAGAPMIVMLSSRLDREDCKGLAATLLDAEGEVLATAPVVFDVDNQRAVANLTTTAPEAPGAHRWQVALHAEDAEEDDPVLAVAEVDFDSCAHSIRPTVWGVPPAVEQGKSFRISVGLRCTAGCPSAGWAFRVLDAEGAEVASGLTGDAPAPGTDALHFAEVELRAPDAEGLHVWTVQPVSPEAEMPHAVQPVDLRLTVTAGAQHVIRVRARDAASGEPIARAKVVAHPFSTLTGADGTAELPVPRGRYRVFVSGRRYFPFRQELEVAGDLELLAELHIDREYDEVEQWA